MENKQKLKKLKYLLKSINKNISKLKKYDRLETKEEIQIIKYDVPIEYYNFKENKLRDLYIPFAIISGMLDGFIEKRQKQIDLYKNEKTLYRYEIEIEYAKKTRMDIAKKLDKIKHKLNDEDRSITKSIQEAIKAYPTYTKFNEIYEEGKNSKYNNIYMEFINNYNTNYLLGSNLELRNIRYVCRNYQRLFNELNSRYVANEEKIEKARIKEKSKRYINYL